MPSANLADVPLNTLLKELVESQTKRRREQKVLDLMEEREKTITAEILKREKQGFTSGHYVVDIKRPVVPNVTEWDKLLTYIKDTGSVDLLEKRLLKSGAEERRKAGIVLPGVEFIEKPTLKVEVQ
jgi:hypothetical protein